MAHVDALSRVVALVNIMALEKELTYKQLQDSYLKQIAQQLEKEEHSKFDLIDGLVYRKCLDKPRFVVPESMLNNIIRVYHDDMAHCGLDKTLQGLSANYWFPAMRRRIRDYISNCLTCLLANCNTNSREGEMQIAVNVTVPFQIVHADHFGPLTQSPEGYKHILLIVDAFTRFTWLLPVKSTSSRETIKQFQHVFKFFGFPQEIVTDRGTAFASREFADFVHDREIKHRLIAVAAPWANGLVERVNRFLKSSLKKLVEDQNNWSSQLSIVQYVINNTFHKATKSTPSKLLFGYDQHCHADSKLVKFLNNLANIELNSDEQREIDRKIAIEATDQLRNYNKAYYDKRHKAPTKYNPEDYVLIRDTFVKPDENKKLKPSYKGPYMIAKKLNNNRYVIQDIPGFNITAKPYNSILSPDRIKPWIKPPK